MSRPSPRWRRRDRCRAAAAAHQVSGAAAVRRRDGGVKPPASRRRRDGAWGLFVRVGCLSGRWWREGGFWVAAEAAGRVLKKPAPPPHPSKKPAHLTAEPVRDTLPGNDMDHVKECI